MKPNRASEGTDMWLTRETDLCLLDRDPEWEEFIYEEMLAFYEECGYCENEPQQSTTKHNKL